MRRSFYLPRRSALPLGITLPAPLGGGIEDRSDLRRAAVGFMKLSFARPFWIFKRFNSRPVAVFNRVQGPQILRLHHLARALLQLFRRHRFTPRISRATVQAIMLPQNFLTRFFHILIVSAPLLFPKLFQCLITGFPPFLDLLLSSLTVTLCSIIERLFLAHDDHLLNFLDEVQSNVERSIEV